ncbi:hypothetical protein DFS34DRAFT_593550 [Phlyctochytrium arcticum]|nr:hypothetical protein DFS34DRAFT_653757 [Phlyctochytrium arcticum]KAI9098064.1 hypothetical protein DFS34DRAFT_593550 [Phlyctochytrium arcticum]
MLSFDPTSSWEEQQEMVRKTFIRTGDTVPDEQLLGEDLSDVVIEVHPEVEAGVTPGTANIAAARIPAHSAILANRSKSFHTLFTNVMAQSKITKEHQVEDQSWLKSQGIRCPSRVT